MGNLCNFDLALQSLNGLLQVSQFGLHLLSFLFGEISAFAGFEVEGKFKICFYVVDGVSLLGDSFLDFAQSQCVCDIGAVELFLDGLDLL